MSYWWMLQSFNQGKYESRGARKLRIKNFRLIGHHFGTNPNADAMI